MKMGTEKRIMHFETWPAGEFLSDQELNKTRTRRAIAARLAEGQTYKQIANELHVSPQTIAKVKKMMGTIR